MDLEDVKLAVQAQTSQMFSGPPSREILIELASRKNSNPLPILERKNGFRLPSDNQCLLAANYKITSMVKCM